MGLEGVTIKYDQGTLHEIPKKINKNIISWENITLGALKASLGHMSRPCLKIKQEEYPILNEYYWVVNIF